MKEVYQQTKQELFEKYGNAIGNTEERARKLLQEYGSLENIYVNLDKIKGKP